MSETEYKLKLALHAIGRGKVSRREVMQLALAAGLTAAAADQLYVSAARAQPKSGGYARLGMAHGATTDNLDPASWPDTFTQTAFGGGMSNGLTEVDAKGNVQAQRPGGNRRDIGRGIGGPELHHRALAVLLFNLCQGQVQRPFLIIFFGH